MDFYSALSLFLSVSILSGGLFFTFYLKGFFFIHPVRTFKKTFTPSKKGGLSPIRALSASLAGSLGVGNIAGVAFALMLGGAGAVFWMWLSALASMVLKYCEITLGVKYRVRQNGKFAGGPMFYMEKGVGGKAGRALAAVFSCACVASSFALGNIVQVNAALESAQYIFGADKIIFGAIFAASAAAVISTALRTPAASIRWTRSTPPRSLRPVMPSPHRRRAKSLCIPASHISAQFPPMMQRAMR
jgi:AGCS family alanine or glycine:cation symporter